MSIYSRKGLLSRGGGSGTGSAGAIWITDVVVNGTGNVLINRFVPIANEYTAIESINSDASSLIVSVTWDRGSVDMQGVPTINGIQVTNVVGVAASNDTFTGSATIPIAALITAKVGRAKFLLPVSLESPAIITDFNIVNNPASGTFYPVGQTEVKAGDIIYVSFVSDKALSTISFQNLDASAASTVIVAGTDLIFTSIQVTVGSLTTVADLKQVTMQTQTKGSAWSTNVLSINNINCNNLYPTLLVASVVYPNTQLALKGSETAIVNLTTANVDTILYSSTGQLDIPNTTVDETSKVVTRLLGDYNITVDNFLGSAARTANGAITTLGHVVWIADQAPLVGVSAAPLVLKSGGNDNTSAQTYQIVLASTQLSLVPPTIEIPVGAWASGSFVPAGTVYSKAILIQDTDLKGVHTFGAFSFINLAGIELTTPTTGSTYELRGFVQRLIVLEAFQYQAGINVPIVDPDKVIVHWQYLGINLTRTLTSDRPQKGKFFIDGVSTPTPSIWLLDKSATDASSQQSIVEIQETI